MIEFMNEIDRGFMIYPMPGTFMDQPRWFMELLRLAQRVKVENGNKKT